MSLVRKFFRLIDSQPTTTRPPKLIKTNGLASSVVTTDFFGFDTSDNHYNLKVLGMVAAGLQTPLRWFAVRNVSDPQIKAEGTIKDRTKLAGSIYKGFGRWSTVCSAIVRWALIAAE